MVIYANVYDIDKVYCGNKWRDKKTSFTNNNIEALYIAINLLNFNLKASKK